MDIGQDEAGDKPPTHIPHSRASLTARAWEMGAWEMEAAEKTALASTMRRWRDSFFEGKNMALSEEEKSSNATEQQAGQLRRQGLSVMPQKDNSRRAANSPRMRTFTDATCPASSTFSRDAVPAPDVDCGGGRRPEFLLPRVPVLHLRE